ncbi:hypothetical protein [Sinimarinibacterium thermocellulolyticum]|uniref:Uncharacterized protein n=1 Tax=Sinimarinibacterium thermocellulolyticum TaxID=3170016 RepID=A0ABV2AA18_9GAMM
MGSTSASRVERTAVGLPPGDTARLRVILPGSVEGCVASPRGPQSPPSQSSSLRATAPSGASDEPPSRGRNQVGFACYVSPSYFAGDDPFADFIVHEAAHIFHNCKRRTIGLRETRRREWLLDIELGERETFAYSCEAYARIVARAKSPAERRALAAEYGSKRRISEERVDPSRSPASSQRRRTRGTDGR